MVAAMIRKEIRALRKSPYLMMPPLTLSRSAEKSGLCTMAAINGLIISATSAFTIAEKAAPMTTATARSTTLPRRIKSRNPLSIGSPDRGFLLGRVCPKILLQREALLTLFMLFELARDEMLYKSQRP